jgi:heme oxygenase
VNESAAQAPDISTRLRTETRTEHELLEASLELMSPSLTRAAYARCLERFFGIYAPIEQALCRIEDWQGYDVGLDARLKTPLIERDLRALGAPSTEAPPPCMAWTPFADLESAFGCLYVVEGASLGGQLICRHVEATLGITAETGGSFFRGYGERTAQMWRSFRQQLLRHAAAGADQDRIVASALATFKAFRSWCAPAPR